MTGLRVHPSMTNNWVESKLFFGLSFEDAPGDSLVEVRWRHFLDHEVTPRFPAGLTVFDGYGQWLPKSVHAPKRLRSKVLIVVYPASAENAERIDAIRTAWKKLTGEQSVLVVTMPAEVSF